MAYGMNVYSPSGKIILGPDVLEGRIFIDQALATAGNSTSYTYSGVASHTEILIYPTGFNSHSHTLSTVSSSAVLTLTAKSTLGYPAVDSYFLIFAKDTIEPSYGLECYNSSGKRIVSVSYPVPEYLGTVTASTSTSNTQYGDSDTDYTEYFYEYDISSLGSGRDRLVLYNLATNTNDCWFSADSIPSANKCIATVSRNPTSSFTMPTAYVFALNGHTASSDTYGARIFNSSSGVVFDSGLKHMVFKSVGATLDIPTTNSTTYSGSYTTGLTTTGDALFMFPRAQSLDQVRINSSSYQSTIYTAGIRRDGTTLYTRVFSQGTNNYSGDVSSSTYYHGDFTNITQAFCDTDDI